MAERAALVRRQGRGEWNVYRSQWGGTDRALAAVCGGVVPSGLAVSWRPDRSVDSFTEAVAGLDYLGVELVYREPRGVKPFLALWFGLPLETAEPHPQPQAGATVEIRSLKDARRLRAAFRRDKNRLADALETGALPASAAPFVLFGWIHRLQGRELYVVSRGIGTSDILYTVTQPDDP